MYDEAVLFNPLSCLQVLPPPVCLPSPALSVCAIDSEEQCSDLAFL